MAGRAGPNLRVSGRWRRRGWRRFRSPGPFLLDAGASGLSFEEPELEFGNFIDVERLYPIVNSHSNLTRGAIKERPIWYAPLRSVRVSAKAKFTSTAPYSRILLVILKFYYLTNMSWPKREGWWGFGAFIPESDHWLKRRAGSTPSQRFSWRSTHFRDPEEASARVPRNSSMESPPPASSLHPYRHARSAFRAGEWRVGHR